ncbi:MAG: four helix bundle protein [Desulfobulbaceae bacterium]|jgi:four helix bundle protein|nr:four helix bundle protein [Desulfobulbaceae bacterium]
MGQSFEDLEVWKVGCRLAVSVLEELQGCNVYALKDQMVRSAISIPSNIAEGSERFSAKDFRRFVAIALGSAAELRTQVYIGQKANIITKSIAENWIEELKSISKMLQALAKSLK